MSVVYKYDYARSTLERALIEAGQFAHVPEADIVKAFDDVESDSVADFEYRHPACPQHAWKEMREEQWAWPWSCSEAKKQYRFGDDVLFGFYAAPMATLLWKRHGCLCGLCMNPTAKYRVMGLHLQRELHIGKTGDESNRLPNCCEECLSLATLDHWCTENQFIHAIRKQLTKPDSPLIQRLRSAPPLRFEPRRA